MSSLFLNSDRFHGSARDIRIWSYQDAQYCFQVIGSTVGGFCPPASSAARRSMRFFQACVSSGGELQCTADVKQRNVIKNVAKRVRIDLTRSRSNNCVFKGAIIGPNTLAFVGRDLTIDAHASQCTGGEGAKQTQTPRPSPRRYPSPALFDPHGAGVHRLDSAVYSFP
ncbi:MAG: hypothetical protein QOG67_366 [Verrucomicrobiota bacterium]